LKLFVAQIAGTGIFGSDCCKFVSVWTRECSKSKRAGASGLSDTGATVVVVTVGVVTAGVVTGGIVTVTGFPTLFFTKTLMVSLTPDICMARRFSGLTTAGVVGTVTPVPGSNVVAEVVTGGNVAGEVVTGETVVIPLILFLTLNSLKGFIK
jgi:hypothetical protein